jgi:hypothetical protein
MSSARVISLFFEIAEKVRREKRQKKKISFVISLF